MKHMCLSLIVMTAMIPAYVEGQLFGKKSGPRTDPKVRVPELLYVVKMDPDERRRAAAAEELRDYNPQQFAEIVPDKA